MVGLGVKRENIFVVDSKGVMREGRDDFAGSTRASCATASAPTRARWPTW
jgi:malic enzyme